MIDKDDIDEKEADDKQDKVDASDKGDGKGGAKGKAAAPDSDDGEYVAVEDTRVSAEDQAGGRETRDERVARRREEKKQRRERQREARAYKDRKIADLEQEVVQLREGQRGITKHLTDSQLANVDARLEDANSRYREATSIIAEAVKKGDAEAMTQAMEIRDNARDEARALKAFKQNAEKASKERPRADAQRRDEPDPEVARRGMKFAKEHSWYNPREPDRDTRIVLAIDAQITAEGYDPKSDEYWEELDEQLRDALPHRFKNGEGDAEDDGEEDRTDREKGPAPKRGPQLGGTRSSTIPGKKTVFVSAERKAAMVESGAWDDPVKRKRMLKAYADYDAQHQPNR